MKRLILLFCVLFAMNLVHAENFLSVRSHAPFDAVLQEAETLIEEYGYKLAHVQRCDGGLADFGYKSDYYRILFIGKLDEVRAITARYPELVPFLPLKILVFAENNETVSMAMNPLNLLDAVDDEQVGIQLTRWHSDLSAILLELQQLHIVVPEQTPAEPVYETVTVE
jgi:uncharacterized protein (DUF302 family)